MTQTFARHMRLVNATDFQQIFADSCRSADSSLLVLARSNDQAFPRLGFAIARKHVKTAVARNRLKRVIRESFRKNNQLLSGLDIVVLARPGVMHCDAVGLRDALDKHWKRITRKCANL